MVASIPAGPQPRTLKTAPPQVFLAAEPGDEDANTAEVAFRLYADDSDTLWNLPSERMNYVITLSFTCNSSPQSVEVSLRIAPLKPRIVDPGDFANAVWSTGSRIQLSDSEGSDTLDVKLSGVDEWNLAVFESSEALGANDPGYAEVMAFVARLTNRDTKVTVGNLPTLTEFDPYDLIPKFVQRCGATTG